MTPPIIAIGGPAGVTVVCGAGVAVVSCGDGGDCDRRDCDGRDGDAVGNGDDGGGVASVIDNGLTLGNVVDGSGRGVIITDTMLSVSDGNGLSNN